MKIIEFSNPFSNERKGIEKYWALSGPARHWSMAIVASAPALGGQ
jgi:hypothetical protein